MRGDAVARAWPPTEDVDRAAVGALAGPTPWARLPEDVRRRRIDHLLARKLDRAFRCYRPRSSCEPDVAIVVEARRRPAGGTEGGPRPLRTAARRSASRASRRSWRRPASV